MIVPTPAAALFARDAIPLDPGAQHCPKLILPAGGVIALNDHSNLTLTANVTYYPNCAASGAYADPFYASTTVFIYVIATTTVIAWVLLILLLITQRDSSSQPPRRTTGWFQGRGVPSAIAGRTPLGGLGNRPWLQKVAVLFVTVGLTVASVDTFTIAETQHQYGITNARWMRDAVVRSYEIRVLRVVSGVFVWLAQVQTLIRLFPRRKEKLIIKWFGFSLILCDLVFSCLNSFYANSRSLPGSYQDAIPALSYLFQLSISLLYAAWVLYYVATKRRYAFFKADQLNMSIIAALALTSIAIPVAFFIADISVPPVAGWGDFFRWTGAAAASVVVWEWVERIEAAEREEKKDGILGREVFDEDELPTTESSSEAATRRGLSESGSDEKGKRSPKFFGSVAHRYVRGSGLRKQFGLSSTTSKPTRTSSGKLASDEKNVDVSLGNRVILSDRTSRDDSPPSRADTGSVGSTVYAVHYHPVQHTPPVPNPPAAVLNNQARHSTVLPERGATPGPQKRPNEMASQSTRTKSASKPSSTWALASNVFKRRKRSPPLVIKKAVQQNGDEAHASSSRQDRFGLRGRLVAFGAGKGDQIAGKASDRRDTSTQQQPTVIPAPPRGQTWSPEILRHSPVNFIQASGHVNPALAHRTVHGTSTQSSAANTQWKPTIDRHQAPSAGLASASGQRNDGEEPSAVQTNSGRPTSGGAEVPLSQDDNAARETEQTSDSSQTDHSNEANGQSTDSDATAVGSSQPDDDVRPDPG